MNDVEEKEKNTEKGGSTVASFAFLQKRQKQAIIALSRFTLANLRHHCIDARSTEQHFALMHHQ